MDPAYITPFVSSISNVFETMLQLPVNVGAPSIKSDSAPTYDVSGIIGMTGDVEGTVVLSFPTATAERAVAVYRHGDASRKMMISDAIGELVNMVSGGMRSAVRWQERWHLDPTVVMGSGHNVPWPQEHDDH